MQQDDEASAPGPDGDQGDEAPLVVTRKRWKFVVLAIFGLLLVAMVLGWLNREQVASNLIGRELARLGVPGQYEITRISPGRQVVEHVVIGDPARPDLTIERVEVTTKMRFGFPRFSHITLVRPRLFGSYRDGTLSFGSLDPAIFVEGEEPFDMPDVNLEVRDGRALLETDFGPVGFKAAGSGELRGGFSGILAATAPDLAFEGCEVSDATVYARLTVTSERPRLQGPLRLGGLACEEQDLRLARSGAELDVTLDEGLDGGEAALSLAAGPLNLGESAVRALAGDLRMTYRKDALVAQYELAGKRITAPQVRLASLAVDGRARSSGGLARIDLEGDVAGAGLAMGGGLDATLASAAKSVESTLFEPILEQIRTALARESRSSSLAGNFLLRRMDDRTSLVVPQASVRGGSGDILLSLSRLQVALGDARGTRVAGNFATGGRGLPRIVGRMEGAPGKRLVTNIRMPEYRAGNASIELPRLVVVQEPGGALGFAGVAMLDGPLPGGRVEALALPLDGNWSSRNGLAVWRRCIELRFARLEFAGLSLSRNRLPVCPPRGSAIVRSTRGGLTAVAGFGRLDLSGRLGSSPVRITSAAAALSAPGRLSARDIAVQLGTAGNVSHFRIGQLEGRLGGIPSGRFADARVLLDAVPLDVLDAAGSWRYSDGVLFLADGSFRLEDRQQVDRFQPLVARDATLRLADNVITADAELREPGSMREILRTELRHNLSTGTGSADLFVEGVRFDEQLQPDTLTYLALGTIANARGVVRGTGRIDWNERGVTSTGSFTTDSLDFAAAFGPVTGLSGTIEFTDLLGLVTAPDQRLRVAAINPGIEVTDGTVEFELDPEYILRVKGGKWPFLGGTLTLEPVTMNIGTDEIRRYTLVIEGLDAARFVEHIEMENLAATGTFDGVVPLVFDQHGGRIEGGRLASRPPGGNISYVGELTYEDLSPMGNFAFNALKSVDYRQMRIEMEGAIEGEIITRVAFDGLSQGETATKNFLTRRIATLPIRFRINIRAPFFRLVTSIRSLYDPEYLRDPRSLGLLDLPGPADRAAPPPAGPSIQPSDSETVP